MDIARKIAVQALEKCEKSGYSNLILNHSLETSSLSQRDKGFVSILVYGTVERMYYLNYILQKFVTKPLAKLDAPVRVILQSALYQCLFLDTVPNSAAINEAVTLTRAMGKTSAAGFVNAVLRKAAAVKTEDLTFKNEIEKTSVLYSVSESLTKFFIDNFPLEYKEILSATLTKPKTVICVNTLKTTEENLVTALTKNGAVLEKEDIQNAYAVQYKGDITKTDEFKNGHFYVQGLPSQIAALTLGAKAGDKVIDVCSAPGGKAATVARGMQNKGEIICCDLQENRLSLIESLLKRVGITNAKVMQWDATVFNKVFENADAVLCDVPCSGIGIMAKKPDIRHKNVDDLSTLIDTQKAILKVSSQYVKVGGHLVYSTCTINKNENENVVNDFLTSNKNFALKNIDILKKECAEMVTFLPQKEQSDGFFVAYLERLC